MTDTRTFIGALWPLGLDEGEQVALSWQLPGGNVINASYTSTDELAEAAGRGGTGRNVWLNIASRRAGTDKRGSEADCLRLPALWADLDIAHEGAHADAGFATEADAYAALAAMPVAPTMIVHTGYGLSAWWVLDEPADVTDARPLLAALKATVGRVTEGRHDPAVYDVARMMRLPGTQNVKVADSPRPARIVDGPHPARRYGLSDLADLLDLPEVQPRPAGNAAEPGDDFNMQAGTDEVAALLVKHGATELSRESRGDRTIVRLARPGVTDHQGLTVGWHGDGITHVFTSGWPALPKGSYDPLGVYARLEHGGDFAAAYAALATEGYGADVPTLDVVPELNPLDVARGFVDWLDGLLIHASGMGWLWWDGTRYVHQDNDTGAHQSVNTYVDALVATCKARHREAIAAGDKDAVKVAKSQLTRAETYKNGAPRDRILVDAARLPEVALPADALDSAAYLLNVTNGVVDLRTGELLPHDRRYLMTKCAAAPYTPGASSEDWTKALGGLSEPMTAYLRTAVGLSATGKAIADAMFIAYGAGGNGKTTVLGAVEHALGDYAVTLDAKVLMEGKPNVQEKMPLRGARFALAAETGEDHYLAAERMKALTGGDKITDRYLYSRSVATWHPTHTLWLMTNHRPRVRSTDAGTWRRLRLVPFAASYIGAPDRGLKDRLATEEVNRTAVLAWVVAGAVEWNATSELPTAPEVELATMSWREDESPVGQFMADKGYEVTGDEGDTVRSGELYEAYKTWCDREGIRPLGGRTFPTEVERHAEQAGRTLARGKDKYGKFWRGMRKVYSSQIGALDEVPKPQFEPIESNEDGLPW